MASLKSTISGSPTIYSTATITEKSRSGGTTVLNISISTSLQYQSSYLGSGYVIKGTVTANGTTKTFTLKESSASWSGTTAHKVTGTMSISVPAATNSITIKYQAKQSGLESASGSTKSGTLSLSKQASSISSTVAGTPLGGVTVNLNKVSGLTDNIVLSYNGQSITRNSFGGGKITFSDSERRQIFAANGGGGISKTWSIAGTSKSGSTTTGTYSGSVSITTEAAGAITSAINNQVGDKTLTVSVNHPYAKSGVSSDYVKVTAYRDYSNSTYSHQLGSATTTTGTSAVITLQDSDVDDIYSSNINSKSGNIYYKIESYVNNALITGSTKYYTGTYSFIEDRCCPVVDDLQIKINDTITPILRSSIPSSYISVDSDQVSTILDNLITEISLLKYKVLSSGRHSAQVSSASVTITGQSPMTVVSEEATQSNFFTGDSTVTATVVDTRGFSVSKSFNVSPMKYSNPTFNELISKRRPKSEIIVDNDQKLVIDFSISIPSFITSWTGTGDYSSIRRFLLGYRYRVFGEELWSSWKNIPFEDSDINFNVNVVSPNDLLDVDTSMSFDVRTQYEVQFVIRDAIYQIFVNKVGTSDLGETFSDVVIIPTSEPLIAKRSRKIGVNKTPEVESGIDVDGVIESTGHVKTGEYIKAGSSASVGTFIEFPFSHRDKSGETGDVKLGNGKSQIRARRSMAGTVDNKCYQRDPDVWGDNYYEDIITFRNGRILDNMNEVAMLETVSGTPDEILIPEEAEQEWTNLLTHYADNDLTRCIFYNSNDRLFDKDVNQKVKMSYNDPIVTTVPVSNVQYYDSAQFANVQIRPIDLTTTSLNNNGTNATFSATTDSKFNVVKFENGRYSNLLLGDLNKTYLVKKFAMGTSSLVGDSNFDLDKRMILYDSEYLRYLSELPKNRWTKINSLFNGSFVTDESNAFNDSDLILSTKSVNKLLDSDGYAFFEYDYRDYVDDPQTGEHLSTSPKIVLDGINNNVNTYFNDNNACKFGTNIISYGLLKDLTSHLFLPGGELVYSSGTYQSDIILKTIKETTNYSVLPDTYQQVEYIEGTGTQYIDTAYCPKNTTGIVATFKFNDTSILQQRVYGVYGDDSVSGSVTYTFYINGGSSWAYASKDLGGQWTSLNIPVDTNKHTLRFNVGNSSKLFLSNTTMIDEATTSNLPTVTGSGNSLYILAAHNFDLINPVKDIAKARIYSFDIYEGDNLVHRFIPCYHKSDNAAGMYDLVTGAFHRNAGTGTFNIGPEVYGPVFYDGYDTEEMIPSPGSTIVPRLPNEYQEIDYIQSSGTQYIDTGYIPDTYEEFDVDVTYLTGNGCLFGAYNTTWTDGIGMYHNSSTSSYDYRHYCDNVATSKAGSTNNRQKISFRDGSVTVNGTQVSSLETRTFSVDSSICILASNMGGTKGNYLTARLHRFKIYKGLVLIHDYIPCYRKSDNVAGMYDVETNTFYTNAGTGTFVKGPNVNNPGRNSLISLLSGFDDYRPIENVTKPPYTYYNYCTRDYARYQDVSEYIWDIIYNNTYTPYSDNIVVRVSVNNSTFDHAADSVPQLTYNADKPAFITGTPTYRIEDENGVEVLYNSSLPAGTYSIEIASGISPISQNVSIIYSAGVLTVTDSHSQDTSLPYDIVRLNDHIRSEMGWSSYQKLFKLAKVGTTEYVITYSDNGGSTTTNITSYNNLFNTLKSIFTNATSEIKNRNFTTDFLNGNTPYSVADALKGRMLTLVNEIMQETYEFTSTSGTRYVLYDSSSGTNPVGSPVTAPVKLINDDNNDFIQDVDKVAYSDIYNEALDNGAWGGSDLYDAAAEFYYNYYEDDTYYNGTYLITTYADNSQIDIVPESASPPYEYYLENTFIYSWIKKFDFGVNQSSTVDALMEIDFTQFFEDYGDTEYDVFYTFRFHNYAFDIEKFYDVTTVNNETTIELKEEYADTDRVLVAWDGGLVYASFSSATQDIKIKCVYNGDCVANIAKYKLIGNSGIYSQDVYTDITLAVDPSITASYDYSSSGYTPFPIFVDDTIEFTSRISFYINGSSAQETSPTPGTHEPVPPQTKS